MKRYLVFFGLVLALALAACGGQQAAEETPVAEEGVEVQPTAAAPAEEEPVEEATVHTADPMLVGKVWQWQGTVTPVEEITVADPSRYTILFNEDGSANIQSDCNVVVASYVTDGSGSISITLGPTTLAACAEDSQDQLFNQQLSNAAVYFFQDGELYIDQFADAGTMRFAEAGDMAEAEMSLTGTVWQWQGTVTPAEEIAVADPSRYTIVFNEDGSVNIQSDCNVVLGSYTTDESGALTIMLGPTTLAACPEDSQDQLFNQQLSSAAIYFFQDGELFIDQAADAGTMRFAAAGEMAEMEPSLTGAVWQWQGTVTPAEEIAVADPSRYTIVFNEDNSVNIQSDCNVVLGSYATDEAGALTIMLGPTTLAACAEDSQDQLFNQQLSSAAIYFFQDGELYIDLFADGGTMRFAATGEMGEPTLTGATWLWQGTITPVEEIAVADPTRYAIEFNEDGTANITADCNSVIATYTTDEGGAISIMPGPSTLVACPPDSQDQVFLQQLTNAAIYFFQDGELYIDQFADGGTMRFSAVPEVELPDAGEGQPSGTVNAPDGVFLRTGPGTNYPAIGAAPQGESGLLVGISADGQWYVADAPNLPGGQVWVAAAFVDVVNAENLPVIPAPPLGPSLVGPTWQWVSLTTPVEQTQIADPTRYTIVFNADGTANIQADCNMVIAQTMVDGNRITIMPGPSTLVACPPDSQDQLFLQSLSNGALFFFDGGNLFIDMALDSGTLQFAPAGAAVAPPDPNSPSGGAAGVTFRVVSFGPAGAETPVIAGTTITAQFDDAALLVSGSGGCNSYTGSLIPQDGFFTVGPIASTLMACASPEGIMEQEAAFLAALGATNGYQWQQQVVNNATVVTAGQLFYTLADGTNGVINLVSP